MKGNLADYVMAGNSWGTDLVSGKGCPISIDDNVGDESFNMAVLRARGNSAMDGSIGVDSAEVLGQVLSIKIQKEGSTCSASERSRVGCSLVNNEVGGGVTKVRWKQINDMGGVAKRRGSLVNGINNKVEFSKRGRKIIRVYKDDYVNKKGKLEMGDKMEVAVQKSGRVSVCYDDKKEESDIGRNNARQLEFLDKDIGDKFWSVIVALGVVDVEGKGKLMRRIENLENGGGKDRDVRRELNTMK